MKKQILGIFKLKNRGIDVYNIRYANNYIYIEKERETT